MSKNFLSEFNIGKKRIGGNNPVFIVAEIGINHNGSLQIAKKLIDIAKTAGADAVKFQSFIAKNLVTATANSAKYQHKDNSDLKQIDILKKVELQFEDLQILKSYSEDKDLIFLSTPFDLDSLHLLEKIDLDAYKISSGDLTNPLLLNEVAKLGKPILLSSGMADIDEIKESIQWIVENGCNSFVIMQCTSCYPTEHIDCNLNAVTSLQNLFHIPIGFSDHTIDSTAAIMSVGLGVKFIEKHITLDHNMEGPDHEMSMEPNDFTFYVKSIRNAEKILGDGIKKTLSCEQEIKKIGRKSIVSKKFISKDHIISKSDLDIKRPGTGIQPKFFNSIIGKKTKYDIEIDQVLEWDDLEN
jgi:N,N'-diacetyllegionaminate synthase